MHAKWASLAHSDIFMDYPNGFIDHEYRGFRIRYARDAFETSHTVVSFTIKALSPQADAAIALTGGMPHLGWEIAPGDRIQAFLERTHAAIDEMVKKLEDSSASRTRTC